ncbi:MAG TPA: MlaD family protein [Thermoleophilaceae bacterium]|nr:MlaD family protein [Thermoleophilaceae bacterium]
MRRLLFIGLVLLLCAGAVVLAGAGGGDENANGKTYKIVFDNAFGLTEGGDLRVGGVNAGETTDFEATKDTPPKAEVTAKITQPGFGDLRSDATCAIKPQSLIGEYFVDCQPGSSPRKLEDGDRIPVRQTSSTIPLDLVSNVLRRPYRERLRLIINELGTGLAGRPEDLQQLVRRAHPGLRETSQVLQILGRQNRVIENFLRDADTVVGELEARKQDASRFIVEAGKTAEITATRREELRETFRRLPGFLGELRPTMARLEDLADEQIPLLTDVQRAAPSLDRFLARLGPFAEAGRPAIRSLGQASEVGTRAFNEGSNEVRELRALAADAPAAAKPLRQFLESLDDRRRAIDSDPRGKVGAPPESDVSNKGRPNNGGFTGLEDLWNFFYWSGMSLNGFDDVSHFLRVGITLNKCSPYENRTLQSNPELKKFFEDCNQWTGPNQPGVTTPDFTRGAQAAALRRNAGRPAARVGERRSPGQPDAGPLPGQKDISKPQVVLPPAVQKLLGELPKLPKTGRRGVDDLLPGTRPRLPEGRQPNANQLLDYLLAP